LQHLRNIKQLVKAYGGFDIKTLESAKGYFNEYGVMFGKGKKTNPNSFASDIQLECRDMIKLINKGITEVEKGKITSETKHEILRKHLDFIGLLKSYKRLI